jgi:alkanesulfonate monooxygenase SsuD/methylene tetrahydromethanopterin reductase-like flavin-dependent oxidoreductase (luciferase family)
MDIAIGLPNAVPGVDRDSLLEFARRADRRGFSTLGTIDRIVYPNYEPLLALAAAATVTERIKLATTVMLTPLRPNATLLAKQALTLDAMSGGRLVLGVGIGAREDDYEASGLPTKGRGGTFDRQLEQMQRVWNGEVTGYAGPIGPPPVRPGGPEVLVGGHVDAAFERVAKFGRGWIMGGAPPDNFAQLRPQVEQAWQRAGRDGQPHTASLAYFALGPNAERDIEHSTKTYYAWLGEIGEQIAANVRSSEETVQDYVQAFEDVGCGELIFIPASKDPAQVDLLADAVGLGK